jgi:hypothetical protein
MEFVTYKEACEKSNMADSYSRLKTVLSLHSRMHPNEWRRLLGEEWTGFDNIAEHRLSLRHIIGTDGPIREMMNEAENVAYDALPDALTVFRGCGPYNMLGASWTTDRGVAERFPFQKRYLTKLPLLVTGKVQKKNILAVKLDREEFEIVTFSARRAFYEFLHADLNPAN